MLLALLLLESTMPYYWGVPYLVGKMQLYKQKKRDIDTLFLGSSHIYRQIDPALFDSLTVPSTSSYNLATPGLFALESFEFYENFLKNDISPKVKYVIMELQNMRKIADKNLHAVRTKYYLNLDKYMFAMRYYSTIKSFEKARIEIMKNYSIAFIENIFKIGMIKPMLLYSINPQNGDDACFGKAYDGFVPLEDEFGRGGKRWQIIRENPDKLKRRMKHAKKMYSKKSYQEPNKLIFSKFQELIALSEQRNVRLVFLLCPLGWDYRILLPVFDKIEAKNKIDLGNPFENSEFYMVDYCYDYGHLNNRGANLFTERLANKFNALQKT